MARSAALLALAVVAGIALGVVPSLTGPEAVSAETILDRAEFAGSAASTTVSTYHLLMMHVGKDAGSTTSEVWFDGPDRQRTIQHMIGANGAVVTRQDVVFNGPDTWIEDNQDGATRVIHTTGTTWTRPADSPWSSADVSELLKRYGDKTCMNVQLEQTEPTVAGRSTYVIVAAPRMLGCDPRIRVNAQAQGSMLSAPAQLTVWVDKDSFLPLRMEVRDGRGSIVDQPEVTSVGYNLSIPAERFTYTPPAGVSVANFTGGDGADVKRALATDGQKQTPPGKAP
jgi:outer membrane lipoprotein-sorting protein